MKSLQVAVLRLALGSSSDTGWRESSRHRPVALELQQYIKAAGCVVEGPIWEGPFEIHAVTTGTSFCLMPEDAYFKKLPGSFGPADRVLEEDKLELCHERDLVLLPVTLTCQFSRLINVFFPAC